MQKRVFLEFIEAKLVLSKGSPDGTPAVISLNLKAPLVMNRLTVLYFKVDGRRNRNCISKYKQSLRVWSTVKVSVFKELSGGR